MHDWPAAGRGVCGPGPAPASCRRRPLGPVGRGLARCGSSWVVVLPAVPGGVAAGAPDRDAVLVQQVQDLFGALSGELLDVSRAHPHSPNRSPQSTTGHRNNPEPSASSTPRRQALPSSPVHSYAPDGPSVSAQTCGRAVALPRGTSSPWRRTPRPATPDRHDPPEPPVASAHDDAIVLSQRGGHQRGGQHPAVSGRISPINHHPRSPANAAALR